MNTNTAGESLCDGIDCHAPAIGTLNELLPVPIWRHPQTRFRKYDLLGTYNYCARHEEAAKHSAHISRLDDRHLL